MTDATNKALEDYCRADAESTVNMYRKFPTRMPVWKIFWRWLAAFVMLKLGLRKSVHMPFLKCDTKGCAYVEFHDEIVPELIGKPCPACGASLLTQKDFYKWRGNNDSCGQVY